MRGHSSALCLLLSALCVSSGCPSEVAYAPLNWTDTLGGSEPGWLMNVHARAYDERYALGGSLESGAIWRFDGEAWTPLELGLELPLLNWIHADASETLVAVGRGGSALHFAEGAWRLRETPTEQTLWGVWGSSMDALWAVGGDAIASEERRGVVLRWEGQAWTRMELPETLNAGEIYAWFKVWGSGPQDVYIVGQRGALLHWNGVEWDEIPLGTTKDLIALWGLDADHVALVGGRNNGVVARWDGASWLLRDMSPMPGLNGVWMRDASSIHVAGNYGTLAVLDFETLETVEELSLETMDDLHALHGSPEGVLTAVGGNLLSQGSGGFRGIAYHRALVEGE